MWTEPATGAEARSVRRWARRILPSRLIKAALVLLGVFLFTVGLGRFVNDVEPVGCFVDCGWREEKGPGDIWDAIF